MYGTTRSLNETRGEPKESQSRRWTTYGCAHAVFRAAVTRDGSAASAPPISLVTAIAQRVAPPGGSRRDVLVLTAGVAAAHALSLTAGPFLTRLYEPEQLGLLAVVMALSGFVAPLASLRYEQAIMLPDDEDDVRSLVALSVLVAAGTTVAAAIVAVVAGPAIARVLHQPELASWVWALPVLVVATAWYQILHIRLSRNRRYHRVAVGRVARSATTVTAQVGGGAAAFGGSAALVGGFVLGLAAEIAVLVGGIGAGIRSARGRIRRTAMRRLAREHWRFPTFSILGGLSTSPDVITFFLASTFPAGAVAMFWLSNRVLSLPISLLGQATSTVFYQRLAGDRRERDPAQVIADVFVGLMAVALVPMLAVAVFGPPLFTVAFGAEWVEAGRAARVLVPALLMNFAAFPIMHASFVYNKQGVMLVWQASQLVSSVVALKVGATYGGFVPAVACYSAVQAVSYLLIVLLAFRWTGVGLAAIPGRLASAVGRLGSTFTLTAPVDAGANDDGP